MVYFKFRIIKQKKTKKQGKKDSLIIFNWDNFIYLYRIYIRKGANGSAVFGRVPKNSYTVRNHLTVRLVTLIFAFELFQISWQIATDRVTEQAHTGISVIGILHCPNILLSKRSSFFFFILSLYSPRFLPSSLKWKTWKHSVQQHCAFSPYRTWLRGNSLLAGLVIRLLENMEWRWWRMNWKWYNYNPGKIKRRL